MKNLVLIFLIGASIYSFQMINLTNETDHFSTSATQSHVKWKGWHLGKTGERYGRVNVKHGNITISQNKISKGVFGLDMNSLTVENFRTDTLLGQKLRGHLLSSDFFHTDSFPEAKFEILSVQDTSGNLNSIVVGNLTLKNTTNILSFLANVSVNRDSITISSQRFEIDRMRWGISYHHEDMKGIPADYLIMNAIELQVDATFYP